MPPPRRLAVVTGASSGLGREFASLLAAEEWDLILASRDQARLDDLRSRLEGDFGVEIRVVACDLAHAAGVGTLLRAVDPARPVDLLINNAGVGLLGGYLDTDAEAEAAMIRLNVSAIVGLTRGLLPAMVARGAGRLLNVASVASFMPGPGMTTYYATKAFVLSYSDALSQELRGTGVSVTCLCPGPTRTEFLARAGARQPGSAQQGVMDPRPVARAGIDGALAGRRRVVPGWTNKAAVWAAKAMPRDLMTALVARIQRSRG